MKFQYISDLHMEHGNRVSLPASAPYLILAGDIGDPGSPEYRDFLKDVSSRFERVFLVAGNHCYYNGDERSMSDTDALISSIADALGNVHYLQNSAYHFTDSDISVYGTTLWSRIKPAEAWFVRSMSSDYTCIPDFDISKHGEMHEQAVRKLTATLDLKPPRRWVVVTHHLPQERLVHSRYSGSLVNSMYASDVPRLDRPDVVAVVYGHTHIPSVQEGKYFCNPLGYPDEIAAENDGGKGLVATFGVDDASLAAPKKDACDV